MITTFYEHTVDILMATYWKNIFSRSQHGRG